LFKISFLFILTFAIDYEKIIINKLNYFNVTFLAQFCMFKTMLVLLKEIINFT